MTIIFFFYFQLQQLHWFANFSVRKLPLRKLTCVVDFKLDFILENQNRGTLYVHHICHRTPPTGL